MTAEREPPSPRREPVRVDAESPSSRREPLFTGSETIFAGGAPGTAGSGAGSTRSETSSVTREPLSPRSAALRAEPESRSPRSARGGGDTGRDSTNIASPSTPIVSLLVESDSGSTPSDSRRGDTAPLFGSTDSPSTNIVPDRVESRRVEARRGRRPPEGRVRRGVAELRSPLSLRQPKTKIPHPVMSIFEKGGMVSPQSKKSTAPRAEFSYFASRTSRTLRARASGVMGFCRKLIPASRTPWWTTEFSVYPET